MQVIDVVQGKVARGDQVILEGKIAEILPIFSMGGQKYERFILDDGTGRITVITPESEKLLLPGDEVRVEARVRPCPYAPIVNCIESESDKIEILEWKWIDPAYRKSELSKGPFDIHVLLHMTKLDDKVMEGIISTELDPLKIKECFEERLESGKSFLDLISTLTAMTMYSVFLKDLSAASSTLTALNLIKGLNIPDDVKLTVDMLSDMLGTMVSREGLAPYISPPKEMKGIIERYPVANELKEIPRLEKLARNILNSIKEGRKEVIIVEFSNREDLEEIRRMAEVVAGLSGSKLLLISAHSLAEEMEDLISDIEELLRTKQENLIIYIEGLELFLPSDILINMVKISPEAMPTVVKIKEKFARTFKELSGKATIIVTTVSESFVDSEILKGATTFSARTGAFEKVGYIA